MKSAPCRKCECRYLGCHDKCEQYIRWRDNWLLEKEANKQDKRYGVNRDAQTGHVANVLKRH